MTMTAAEVLELREAIRMLEHPGVGARIAHVVGSPIERLVGLLPAKASATISAAARKAIGAALKLSLKTLPAHDGAGGALAQSTFRHFDHPTSYGSNQGGQGSGLVVAAGVRHGLRRIGRKIEPQNVRRSRQVATRSWMPDRGWSAPVRRLRVHCLPHGLRGGYRSHQGELRR